MLHEFTIPMFVERVDEAIEKLTSHGYYNLYYDQPIDQFKEENGYGYHLLMDIDVDLKILLDGVESIDIEQVEENIASILAVKKQGIAYQSFDTEEWQQPFPIIDLQNGWFIKPTSIDEEIPANVIHSEPPRAFGSGLHGTTQDCLRFILREDLHGKKVLDLGTGAGLLSVAAALMGAEHVLAVDIEDVTAEVTYNASLNQVENRITVLQADVLDPTFHVKDSFDWILANIAANEIKKLSTFLDSHLAPKGILLLSGMTEWNYQDALQVFNENGFQVKEICKTGEWVTAIVTK